PEELGVRIRNLSRLEQAREKALRGVRKLVRVGTPTMQELEGEIALDVGKRRALAQAVQQVKRHEQAIEKIARRHGETPEAIWERVDAELERPLKDRMLPDDAARARLDTIDRKMAGDKDFFGLVDELRRQSEH